MGRAPCCDKANVKKGPWSAEEDAKLKAYIEEHGTGGNWIALPHKIGLKRCGKSCRLRWLNYLRPNIKHGGFTEEEDQIICNLYISIGSRWSIIAAQLPGRTDNDIKNYWNTRLKKKLLGKRRDSSQSRRLLHPNQASSNEDAAHGEMKDEARSQTLSASALERMQLHMQLQGLCGSTTNYPFSFYYNNPALWPKYHPLGDRVFQNQPAPTAAQTLARPQDSNETLIDSTHQSAAFPMQPEMISKSSTSAADVIQEGIDHSPALGFHSPSSSNFDSVGLHADLQSLLYCKNNYSSFLGHEEQQLGELSSCKELYTEKESSNWFAGNGFEDKLPSMGCWDSALHSDSLMVQDYSMRYEDL
ncbi:hypothetical protein Cni_G05020 [Canna indica]|uniref:Uncharacterized protein n=1 Tax=Canna indica TaxID=4628 RepID=A0AAQ3JVS9_9LILI|nr:hypothetical protein Cni_G05020 [Canna indica]